MCIHWASAEAFVVVACPAWSGNRRTFRTVLPSLHAPGPGLLLLKFLIVTDLICLLLV